MRYLCAGDEVMLRQGCMMGNKTNLFLLGAQKCGTTTVADTLSEHPDIFVPSIKECYFFPLDDDFAKGASWYENEYYRPRAAEAAKWRVDATPFQLASRDAVERIADYADADARFVVTLREPVARAISAYKHQLRMGNETMGFEEALAAEPQRIADAQGARWWRHAYKTVGLYGEQLQFAFEKLGRERFLILRLDELSDRASVTKKLGDFLGVENAFAEVAQKHSNSAAMPKSALVRDLISTDNPIKRLAQAIIPREARTRFGIVIDRLNAGKAPDVQVSSETRQDLAAEFAEDQTLLSSLGVTSHIPKQEYA